MKEDMVRGLMAAASYSEKRAAIKAALEITFGKPVPADAVQYIAVMYMAGYMAGLREA